MKFRADSWQKAGSAFQDAASPMASMLKCVSISSTDARRIGAASGISLFDTALTGVLESMRGIMDELASGLDEGLFNEGTLMVETGRAYKETEEANTIDASRIGL